MIFLDEGWRLLDDEVFAGFIKDKLKTIRKQNGIIGSAPNPPPISSLEICEHADRADATNIFFPNPKADDESYARPSGSRRVRSNGSGRRCRSSARS